jgi:hypothetical protein
MNTFHRLSTENIVSTLRYPLLLLSLTCVCFLGPPEIFAGDTSLIVERNLRMQNIILSWLECIECTDGELKAVVQLGPQALASMTASLMKGPSPASREAMRRYLLSSYKRLKEYEATHPDFHMGQSEEEYIAFYMDNYDAQHRIRAAMAIAAIGGPDAKKALALSDAELKGLRLDVKKAVEESQRKVAHDSPAT